MSTFVGPGIRDSPKEGIMRVFLCGLFLLLAAGLFSDALPLIQMIDVEGGTFQMGNANFARYGLSLHKVTISSFRMGRTEVTQAQFKAVMGVNPSKFPEGAEAPQRPVEGVHWYMAVIFCNKLSTREGLSLAYRFEGTEVKWDRKASGYRLPTQSEWDWAAQGGRKSKGYRYIGGNDPGKLAWSDLNAGGTTHPVATKLPNELGFFDMGGNAAEWCWDWAGPYPKTAVQDPTGPDVGKTKIIRGDFAWDAGSTYEHNVSNTTQQRSSSIDGGIDSGTGLRVVLP
jgi:formylglycine-generating enzyme